MAPTVLADFDAGNKKLNFGLFCLLFMIDFLLRIQGIKELFIWVAMVSWTM
jgi:hypothetical protein